MFMIWWYADDTAIIGLPNFKEQNDALFYFDAIERFSISARQ